MDCSWVTCNHIFTLMNSLASFFWGGQPSSFKNPTENWESRPLSPHWSGQNLRGPVGGGLPKARDHPGDKGGICHGPLQVPKLEVPNIN